MVSVLKNVGVSDRTFTRLTEYAEQKFTTLESVVEEALCRFLEQQQRDPAHAELQHVPTTPAARAQSLVPLYIAEPIISLVEGLLEGDHCLADCLAKGNFGLGTLNFLDGEVVVLDGVAYHQGSGGVRVLQGDERTPFMTVTMFDKANCKRVELAAVTNIEDLQAQLQALLRSRNVVYALLVEGHFPCVKCRAVCKQRGNKRLKDVAAEQVVFEYTQQVGVVVGFWCPPFLGSNLNVPGFHFHFLSADKQRGGHILQLEMQEGAVAHLQEIHRAQVDLPYSQEWLDRELVLKQGSADLAAAEKEH